MASRISRAKDRKISRRPVAVFRPQLEVLEDRVVPALTYHGGPVIPNVEAQAVFLGSNWSQSQATPFNNFLATTVSGSYLNMLGAAGFTGHNGTVGSGGSTTDVIDPLNISPTNLQGYNNSNPLSSSPNAYTNSVLFDSQIRTDLTAEIDGGAVQTPNANTLYVVFVEPNVVVDLGNGENSINTFGAYHGSFSITLNGVAAPVRYAVVPYAGSNGFTNDAGGYANSQAPYLSSFDSMTMVASHEIAESVTDPDANAWYDRSGNEAADIVDGSTVYLNGYAVQRVSAIPGSQADFLALTPAGATASHQSTFTGAGGAFLIVNGVPVADPTAATGHADTSGIRSISTQQGIDDFGQPMVDVLFNDGYAYEYHDFAPINGKPDPIIAANSSLLPWSLLGANAKQAVPDQGVSYVLFTSGNLGEYVDPNYTTLHYGYGVNPGARNGAIASGVMSITAVGVDQLGVNAVEYVRGGVTYEWRDVNGQASTSTTGFTLNGAAKVAGHSAALAAQIETEQAVLLTADPVVLVASSPTGPGEAAAVTLTHTVPVGAVLTAPPPAPSFNHVDGGGADALPADGSAAVNPSDSPASTTNLADVPLFGPLYKEVMRQVKETGSLIPSGLWQAAPASHAAPAAGTQGRPESKGPDADKGRWFGVNALLAVFGLGFLGVTRDDRRRRRGKVEAS